MRFSSEGRIGALLGLLGLAGVGVPMVAPGYPELGWVFLAAALLGIVLLGINQACNSQEKPNRKGYLRRVIACYGMIISGVSFLGFGALCLHSWTEAGRDPKRQVPPPLAVPVSEDRSLATEARNFANTVRNFNAAYKEDVDSRRYMQSQRPLSMTSDQLAEWNKFHTSKFIILVNRMKEKYLFEFQPDGLRIEGRVLERLRIKGLRPIEFGKDELSKCHFIIQNFLITGDDALEERAKCFDYLADLLEK